MRPAVFFFLKNEESHVFFFITWYTIQLSYLRETILNSMQKIFLSAQYILFLC